MKKLLLVLSLLVGLPAFADQVFVCQSCTNPPGGDPNFFTDPTNFDIGLAGKGHSTQTGLLVIVGIYNGTGKTAAPSITFQGVKYGLDGLHDWGETAQQFEMVAGQDAYKDLGFEDINGGNSETFSNWNLGEKAAGIKNASSFELFAFDLPIALSGNSSVALDLSGVSKGSYVIAFSCGPKGPSAESGRACEHGNIADTPFTDAGLITTQFTTTPEPATLALLGSGLIGLFPVVRKKFGSAG